MKAAATKKERNLERIRLNQQRSRDRKRQYTAELEQRVRQLEQNAHHASRSSDADVRAAGLAHENKVRKDLLCVLGIDEETQSCFIRASSSRDEAPVRSDVSNVDADERLEPLSTSPLPTVGDQVPRVQRPQQISLASLATRNVDRFDFSPGNSFGVFDLAQDEQAMTLASEFSESASGCNSSGLQSDAFETDVQSSAGRSGASHNTTCSAWPLDQSDPASTDTTTQLIPRTLLPGPWSCNDLAAQLNIKSFPSDSTTACSIAFSMVIQNNARGYKFIDLESRMRTGYKNGSSPGEECRVLNKVLFDVLAEIT